MIKRLFFILFILLCSLLIGFKIFSPIFYSNIIYIDYGMSPYDICSAQPDLWKYIKLLFIISFILSSIILSNLIFNLFFIKLLNKINIKNKLIKFNSSTPSNKLNLYIGKNDKDNKIFISEKGLYQNILITGTIGSGKTTSAIYPFCDQLINYNSNNLNNKIGMLILDVKGNLHYKIKELCILANRKKDYIVIELGGKYKYNPLDKPNLKASVLANRLKTILLLFSENSTETYWLDKVEQLLAETIKLCRLYNNNYVTFEEIHKLISNQNYYKEKINILREKFLKNIFTKEQCYDLLTSINFYEKEFLQLDSRTFSILKSEVTRITNCFISDYSVLKTFNPSKNETNLNGLSSIINSGKIIVLNMNISEYKNLSKIISAYLKLDFQTEVLSLLSKKNNYSHRSICFICDEYHEFVTNTDAEFFAQSREAKCINIVATQSYTSLLNTLNNSNSVKVIIQNLINKLWFRTDDIFTIEEIQKQIGKEDKEKFSKNISENAKETKYNYFTQSLNSKNSSISESFNSYLQHDFIYDTNFFTQELETFSCLSFLSDGNKILHPEKLLLQPIFKKGAKNG